MVDDRVCIGCIRGPHALRGMVKIHLFLEDATLLGNLSPISNESGDLVFIERFEVIGSSLVIAKIQGVQCRDSAHKFVGHRLFVPADKFVSSGEDEFYPHELLGLKLLLSSGEIYGQIVGVSDFGAGPVIDINLESGGSIMIPFIKDYFEHVDVSKRFAQISVPEIIDAH